jgi:LysM domain
MTEHDRQPPDSMSTQRRASITWARSALTGGLLSLAALAPAAGVAAEPDTGEEGAVGPEHAQDVETDSPTFDPGGADEPTVEVGVPSPPDQPVDIDPVESEPTEDPDSRLEPAPQAEAQLPPETPVAPPEPVQPQPATPPRPPGFSIQPPPTPQSLGAEPGSGPKPLRRLSAVIPVEPPRSAPAPSLEVGGRPVASSVGTAPARVAQSGVEHPSPTGGGARVHIVRPGESLWTIAKELLGPDASAMSIAAEVARLWELNRDRISSGDPDLIAVGERLKLR